MDLFLSVRLMLASCPYLTLLPLTSPLPNCPPFAPTRPPDLPLATCRYPNS